MKAILHTYGITVWGSIPNQKLNKEDRESPVCFGDREKFLDKFRTCIRAKLYPDQNFLLNFMSEHSQLLFNKNKILNLKNFYLYHCANKTYLFNKQLLVDAENCVENNFIQL